MGGPLLELRQLSVHYRRGKTVIRALDDVSLQVGLNETVGLVGESGSGKSTVGRAVLGLAPIHTGSVIFAGEDVTHLRFKDRRAFYRKVQVVFQDPYSSLNPVRTIARTLAEPLEAYGARDKAANRQRVQAMLERVHLPPDAADRYPRQFSGGQRQRIAIARALMLSPRLVICDEAVSALDLSVQAQILNLLHELQAELGLSYLFISHDLEVVRHMCDRVVVLYHGQVMETGPTAAVSSLPGHPYTYALHQASPLPNPRLQRQQRLGAKPAVVAGPVESLDQCPFAPRCPHAEAICWSQRPTLRPSSQGLVACHRYPEWQAERSSARNGAATPASALRLAPRVSAPVTLEGDC
jgi:oligopeptide/dipeptide ABC transporter ATP-binding protein